MTQKRGHMKKTLKSIDTIGLCFIGVAVLMDIAVIIKLISL